MSWGEWTPQEGILASIKDAVQEALIPDSEIQRNVQEKLRVIQTVPDYAYYLLFILQNRAYCEDVRSLSGILLKNNISAVSDSLPKENLVRVGQECLKLFMEPCKAVRTSASNVIVEIAKENIKFWPDLLSFLVKYFEQSDQHSDTALTTIFKICEDMIITQKPSHEIFSVTKEVFPKLIDLLLQDTCKNRKEIIRLTNMFLQDHYLVMTQLIDLLKYLQNVMRLADYEDQDMQKYVCHTFVIYIQKRHESVLPFLNEIIVYILRKTQHEDKDIALQACEFWLAATKLTSCKEVLAPYIDRLVPVLLENMRYSEYELSILQSSLGNDAQIQDLQKDIYPFHVRDKSEDKITDDYYYFSDEENECEGNECEVADVDDYYIGWTLRKCSAASLDAIAVKFGDDILPVLKPYLNEILNHESPLIKETAILALGAIAEGCMNGLKPHLPFLIEYLIRSMNDSDAMIRVITCWTLSRYAKWYIFAESSDQVYFLPVMTILLKHFIDENKRVQRAAVSAFCIFQEEAQMKLLPYIDFILEGFELGFRHFQCRSLYLLYDAVGVLAQSIGTHLSKQTYVDKLMPPIMEKIAKCTNYNDDQFIALLECLANVIPSLEASFLPYAEVVFCHCLQIINDVLIATLNYQKNSNDIDPPDKELLNVAIDVLYSMSLALRNHFIKFVTNSNLVFLLLNTMQDNSYLIRQTSVVLYGELVQLCYPYLASNISDYIPIIVKNLDENYDGVCNNAAWVIGKLCSIMGSNIQPYLPDILTAFLQILKNPNVNRPMYQTVAISMCTILYVCPDVSINDLDILLKNCCLAIRNVRDSEDKEIAVRGLCSIVVRSTEFSSSHFLYFCDTVASFNNMRVDLKDTIRNILMAYKREMGDEQWGKLYVVFPEDLKVRLNQLYGV